MNYPILVEVREALVVLGNSKTAIKTEKYGWYEVCPLHSSKYLFNNQFIEGEHYENKTIRR
tara:strand:- start:271 stop:453 length:183 start_codon:yes stop_codon:yes gene_type:complete